jgi:hypothetical protein
MSQTQINNRTIIVLASELLELAKQLEAAAPQGPVPPRVEATVDQPVLVPDREVHRSPVTEGQAPILGRRRVSTLAIGVVVVNDDEENRE